MKFTPLRERWFQLIILFSFLQLYSCTKTEYLVPRSNGFKSGDHYHDPYRSVIPINITYLTPTDTRASINIVINGSPVDVLFDTGSWGLRVFKGAIPNVTLDTDTTNIFQNYTGGTGLKGKIADANLAIGRLQSGSQIKLMQVDYINRNNGTYVSTGNSPTTNNSTLMGFNGIVGVGLRYAPNQRGVANPLTQMPGNGAFIIHFPNFNDGNNGQLILNPTTEDTQGFTYVHLKVDSALLPNGLNSWMDDQLQGTVTVNGIPYTHNTLLDSGNPADLYYKDATTKNHVLGPDTLIQLSLLTPPTNVTFTTKNRISGQDLIATDTLRVRNVFGIQFFFDYDVLYDQRNGLIGIRKRN